MPFVVDASMAAAWFLPDEGNPATVALLRRLTDSSAQAPSLLWHEVRNILILSVRRKRIQADQINAYANAFNAIAINDAGRGDGPFILGLAMKLNITAYDATYLALAKTEGLPLATLDRRLIDAARVEGVAIVAG